MGSGVVIRANHTNGCVLFLVRLHLAHVLAVLLGVSWPPNDMGMMWSMCVVLGVRVVPHQ